MKPSKFNKVLKAPIGEIAKYSAQELCLLLQETEDQLQRARKIRQWLEAAVALKYQERIKAKRIRLDKPTGVIHLEDKNIKITNDIHKKIEWNQQTLEQIIDDIKASGFNTQEYVDTVYKVGEHKFTNWPTGVQQIFQPARVLKLGNPIYKLSEIDAINLG